MTDSKRTEDLPRQRVIPRIDDVDGQRRITTRDFDPFAFTGIFLGLKKINVGWLYLGVLVIPGTIVLCAAIGGRLGTVADAQLWDNLRRILGIGSPPPAQPNFPLVRDVPTWLLTLSVMSGILLLHRQWRYMSCCLSELAKNGAIICRRNPRSNLVSKLLRIDAMTRDVPAARRLDIVVTRVTDTLHKKRILILLPMLVTSVILAYLLVLGEGNGLFQTLAPPDLSPADRERWLNDAYRSWWAGTSHVLAHMVYFLFAILAVFVILSFQVVGLAAMYVAAAMRFLVEPSADWLNRDGRYGWAPLARVYRTVMWAGALLGATLTVVLLSLGLTNFGWVATLLASYVVLMPVFTFLPWLLFRGSERKAREHRLQQIEQIMADKGIDPERDVERIAPYLAEIDRCRTARIRPLRMGSVSFPAFVTLVVLPIILAIAEIIFPLQFSPN